jgi:disulfide bond formation protein DsbB
MIRKYGIYAAWLVSIVATLGSLYFSEILHYVPCSLCWYQRILMYPLVILLGIASYRQQSLIIPYALPLSILGGCISLWHYLHQKVPFLQTAMQCKVGVPCNQDYINWFGFITIPFLALIAFILISVLLFAARDSKKSLAEK